MASSAEYLRNKDWFKQNVVGCQYEKCETKPGDYHWIDPPHHIIYKSELPKNEDRDRMENLIQLCNRCHNKFHGRVTGCDKHKMRENLILERGLDVIFNLTEAYRVGLTA